MAIPTRVPSITNENKNGGRRKIKIAKSTTKMLEINGVSSTCLSTRLIKISCAVPKRAVMLLRSGKVFSAMVKVPSVKCHVYPLIS